MDFLFTMVTQLWNLHSDCLIEGKRFCILGVPGTTLLITLYEILQTNLLTGINIEYQVKI